MLISNQVLSKILVIIFTFHIIFVITFTFVLALKIELAVPLILKSNLPLDIPIYLSKRSFIPHLDTRSSCRGLGLDDVYVVIRKNDSGVFTLV